ncbi:MAG TPA: outer membrane protein assembly factor BamA [Myxococcaceae bacterium]
MNVSARKTTATWLLAAALLVLVLSGPSRAQGVDGGTPVGVAAPDAGAPSAAAPAGEPDAGSAAAAEAPAAADAGTPGVSSQADVPVQSGSDILTEVRIEGNRRVEPEVIKRALKNKLGRPFDPALTGADIQSLWSLGYFADIQLLTQRLPAGGIAYVVRVVERPSVREWRLQGAEELNKEDLKDTVDLKPYQILDLDAVRRNVKKIQEKYVEKGFFLAEVTYRIVPVQGTNQADVVFVVNEHAKVMVKQVNLIGTDKVSAEELKAQMITREGNFFGFLTGEGTFREEAFQRDLAIIEAAYYDRGFLNVKVEHPTVALSPDKRLIYITVKITEGEQYRISSIDFSGDLIVPKDRLFAVLESRKGDYFSRAKVLKDDQSLADIYQDQGYAYANFNPETQVNPQDRTVALDFRVEKGKLQTIDRIEITGNTKTRDKVIRRELRIYEGDLFNGSGLRRSKERVNALGFFETVEITYKPGTDDSHVIVTVEVKEKSTGSFQVGFGFSSVESFIFTAQVTQNNFLGWGQTVSISAQLSSLRQLVQLSFYDPYFFDSDWIFSFDVYRTQIDQFDFTRQALGGSLGLGYHIWDDLIASVGYTREWVEASPGGTGTGPNAGVINTNTTPLFGRFRTGTQITSAVRLSLAWDRRDNRLFPTRGFYQFASAEFAPDWLGGDLNYARYSFFSRFYFSLPLTMVFKTNLTLGYIANLDPNRRLPVSELYYLGGINTVRGYSLSSISPTILVPTCNRPDCPATPFVVGGNKQFVLNLELEFPIVPKVGVKGVVFVDAGNAFAVDARFFEDKQHSLPLGLFWSTGFGIRWFSPVGPLRFEWGIPLTRRPIDDPILFEFTIGNSF